VALVWAFASYFNPDLKAPLTLHTEVLIIVTSKIKTHPLLKVVRGVLVDLPTPANISYWWNFGSLLGLSLVIQIVTGVFLSIHYGGDTLIAFDSVRHIMRDVNNGWLLRVFHANGASLFFICLFLHTGRGLYYMSFKYYETWMIGTTLLILTIATAFLGYVLPWGQMSFWGATVITNLFSALPNIGTEVVNWIWGGFAVGAPTLRRFYSLHFLLPFVIAGMRVVHILFLHQTGSRNPLGVNSNYDKLPFHQYYSIKDLIGFRLVLRLLGYMCFFSPWLLGDPENFITANPLVTPVHIQPEWYFLFAYAILRSIPDKLGGVIALAASVAILYVIGFCGAYQIKGIPFYPLRKPLFWRFCALVILLTWIGARPVEDPYILVGQELTGFYFRYFLLFIFISTGSNFKS